jgi:hypothetical protein
MTRHYGVRNNDGCPIVISGRNSEAIPAQAMTRIASGCAMTLIQSSLRGGTAKQSRHSLHSPDGCQSTACARIASYLAMTGQRDRNDCPVRDGMSVENAGGLSSPVPSGTLCGDCHIAYLMARGKLVAVNFSTNILSHTGRGRWCERAFSTNIFSLTGQIFHQHFVPSGDNFPADILSILDKSCALICL